MSQRRSRVPAPQPEGDSAAAADVEPIPRRRSTSPVKPKLAKLAAEQPPRSKPKRGGGGGGGGGGATQPLLLLLAVLVVCGGVLYTRFVLQPGGRPAAAPAGGVPQADPAVAAAIQAAEVQRKLQQEQQQAQQQAVQQEASQEVEAPLPPMLKVQPLTPEEKAIFELAAEEHYSLPPGTPPFEYLPVEEQQQQQQEQYAATTEQVEQPQQHQEQQEGEDRDVRQWAEAAADLAFNATVHQQYLDLPPWPATTHEELAGAWNFTQSIYDYAASQPMTRVLSWDSPRLMLFPSFLSPEEVEYMIGVSRDNLERSEVLVAEGEETRSDIRTSFGYWPERDDVTDRITERIHRLIGVPQGFGEGLYVLNYRNGQKYEAHSDQCMDGYAGKEVADAACLDFLKRAGGPQCGPGKGGPTCGDRVATFILYLHSPDKGGHTAFPEAAATKAAMGSEHRAGVDPNEWYCHDDRVLSAAPPAGTGVLFWDYQPGSGDGSGSYEDGSARPAADTVYAAMHSGCPVLQGEKYIATRWIRASGFDYVR